METYAPRWTDTVYIDTIITNRQRRSGDCHREATARWYKRDIRIKKWINTRIQRIGVKCIVRGPVHPNEAFSWKTGCSNPNVRGTLSDTACRKSCNKSVNISNGECGSKNYYRTQRDCNCDSLSSFVWHTGSPWPRSEFKVSYVHYQPILRELAFRVCMPF